MSKYLSVILAFVVLSASLSMTSFAVEEDNISFNKLTEKETVSDYSNYISLYDSSSEAGKDITVEFDSITVDKNPFTFSVDVEKEGLYKMGMDYSVLESKTENISFGLMLDGSFPYSDAQNFELPRMWHDEENSKQTDSLGNEYVPQQVMYDGFYTNYIVDSTLKNCFEYSIFLSAGSHSVCLIPSSGNGFVIKRFCFSPLVPSYGYKKPDNMSKAYKGGKIVLEGEKAVLKSNYFLVGKSDQSTVSISPYNSYRSVINYIGGGNWKTIGDTIVWETPSLEEGYYKLGFSFRQNTLIGAKTYRSLTVDGKIPFKQAENIGFKYSDSWQKSVFGNGDGEPYYIYLSAGVHKIALTVVAGELLQVRNLLSEATAELGDLYVDMTMITGETVDLYRDYDLFSQIPDMEQRLSLIKNNLQNAAKALLEATGQKSGSDYSVINNMIETINQIFKNKNEAHRYKSNYYSNYCSVSSVLQDLCQTPLDLDKIVLLPVDDEDFCDSNDFFKQIVFSVKRFLITFNRDYSSSAGDNKNDDGDLIVWVNWGRDQAQVLSSLIERSFTPKTGIKVDLQLVNASVVQAVLSGNGPDCILQQSRSEPVNLAMRGVLYDLSKFSDCESVLKRYQSGAEKPYRYRSGLYALPDTQNFFMMFYRKDILSEMGIEIPKTWNEFRKAAKILMRNNMSVWLPNNAATTATQISEGVGSANLFPTFLMQNGLDLYSETGESTNLLSSDVMEVFGTWTDYYRKSKFPLALDFYNRFRVGTAPLGISSYSLYTTLKVAAPEINGLWGFTAVPGTVKENGEIDHTTSGSGTGCAILNYTKSPQNAWEFLKWWTDYETQLMYSNNVESILGPSGRVALANVEAIKALSWDDGMLDEMLDAWEQVSEIPEYPGSYYVTRSIYQSFWNVVNGNKNPKDMLMKYGMEANDEIERKWQQYQNR